MQSRPTDFYDIRDNVIPEGNMTEFDKWIDNFEAKNENLTNGDVVNINTANTIETLLGTAIYHGNTIVVAKLNMIIRNCKIKINKMKTLEHIYYASCREKSSEFRGEGYD